MLSKVWFFIKRFDRIWSLVDEILEIAKEYKAETGASSAKAEDVAVESVTKSIHENKPAKEIAERDAWMYNREQPGSGG